MPSIINPERQFPKNTAKIPFAQCILRYAATAEPVHAPVSGNGIATKVTTPQNLMFSVLLTSSALLTFWSIVLLLLENRLSNAFASPENHFVFFIQLKTGIKSGIIKNAGNVDPTTEQIYACHQLSLFTPHTLLIAKGRAVLNSVTGIIASIIIPQNTFEPNTLTIKSFMNSTTNHTSFNCFNMLLASVLSAILSDLKSVNSSSFKEFAPMVIIISKMRIF